MSSNIQFICGDCDSDINFMSETVHNKSNESYKMGGDLVIDSSIIADTSYTPIILDNGFEFDGNGFKIIIKGDGDFYGIFRILNGSVKNLIVVIKNNARLSDGCGWINSSYDFASPKSYNIFLIENCSVQGGHIGQKYVKPSVGCGGISGAFSGIGDGIIGGSCQIVNCSTDGCILGKDCGGIVGAYAGYGIGSCRIINCTTSGDIMGDFAGGICGGFAISCHIINCTTSGDITGDGAGGIAGEYFVTNQPQSIFLDFSLPYSYNAVDGKIVNCSTSGLIGKSTNTVGMSGMGGIAGFNAGICQIINSVSTGKIDGPNCGGVIATTYANLDSIKIDTCLVTNSNDLSSYVGSGRIAGGNASYAIQNTCYYGDIPFNMGGVPIESLDNPNNPTIKLAQRQLYTNCVRCNEYDGYHVMALVDPTNFNNECDITIDKIGFERNNVHPLRFFNLINRSKYIVQRDFTDCDVQFSFSLKCNPSKEIGLFWIPNNNLDEKFFSVIYNNEKIGNLSLANPQTVDTVKACSLWNFRFPHIRCVGDDCYKFTIISFPK